MKMHVFAILAVTLLMTSTISPALTQDSEASGETLELLIARAADGNEKAQLKLAIMYLRGQGVDTDVEQALAYYHMAAERDVTYAQHKLARIYLDGMQVEPDPARALVWLLRAAKLGYVDAQLDLSRLYENGAGITPDLVKAGKWLSVVESLTDENLSTRRSELEAKMSFTQLAQAQLLSRICILTAYQDC